MNIHLYEHALRRMGRSIVSWSLGIAVVHGLYMYFYPVFAEQYGVVQQVLEQMPERFRDFFGLKILDLSTVMGFYALIFIFVQMILAVQAALYGLDLVSVEEREHTADFLLSLPITRAQVLGSRLAAALTALACTQAMTWASAYGFIALFRQNRPYDPALLAQILLTLIPLQLFFLGVGTLVSQIVPRLRQSTLYALALGFGLYVLSAFSDIGPDVGIQWISPFRHFFPQDMVLEGGFSPLAFWVDILIGVVALGLALWRYQRRDIPAVA